MPSFMPHVWKISKQNAKIFTAKRWHYFYWHCIQQPGGNFASFLALLFYFLNNLVYMVYFWVLTKNLKCHFWLKESCLYGFSPHL